MLISQYVIFLPSIHSFFSTETNRNICYIEHNLSIVIIAGQGSPPSSPPLPFPRTVPRTSSNQQHYAPIPQGATSPHGPAHGRTPDDPMRMNNTMGRDGVVHDDRGRNDYARTTLPRLPPSTSTDR